jgi:hypothetical protein
MASSARPSRLVEGVERAGVFSIASASRSIVGTACGDLATGNASRSSGSKTTSLQLAVAELTAGFQS